ncbi:MULTISPECIES: amidase [Sphingomonas]|nr:MULTISPECIES: amidase [Sphingomonas]MBA2920578.1 amidase [Sphingomonas sp. CGMCC 1.13658]
MVRLAIQRIEERDSAVNAFCVRDFERAEAMAADIDERLALGEDPGPLAGVPLAVKDLEHAEGLPTRRGSLFHRRAEPEPRDMPHVARLRAAGAIVLGKVTTAEFGFAGTCDTKLHGTTRNPWRLDRTPGGSSGGSAAAVAAGMVPVCTGSDGAGSIRGPAAFCGLVGLKVSHGRIGRADGASENSQFGVLTSTVADTARCLDIMAGPVELDRMSLPRVSFSYERAAQTLDVAGLKACWSDDMGFAVVDPEVADIARSAAMHLIGAAGLQHLPRPVRFSNIYPAVGQLYTYRLVSRLEAAGYLPDRWDALSDEVRRNFERFPPGSDGERIRAEDMIAKLQLEVAEFFGSADLLLTPTTACTAFGAADPAPLTIAGQDARDTQDCPLTPLANFTWHPSISVPAGHTRDGLPVGLMITGPRHRDDIVLRLARILEDVRPWPRTAPAFA